MFSKLLTLGCFAFGITMATGCNDAASKAASKATSAAADAKDSADKAKETAEKLKKEMDEKVSKIKDEATKSIDLPALETKINALTGDAKTTALSKFNDLKKMFDEFKGLNDLPKLTEMKEKLMTLYAEVKKMAGL